MVTRPGVSELPHEVLSSDSLSALRVGDVWMQVWQHSTERGSDQRPREPASAQSPAPPLHHPRQRAVLHYKGPLSAGDENGAWMGPQDDPEGGYPDVAGAALVGAPPYQVSADVCVGGRVIVEDK